MNDIIKKIEADKEILSTMPQNNKKNISKYIDKIKSLKEEYLEENELIYKELINRYNKIVRIPKENIEKYLKKIEELKKIIDKTNDIKSSYEKIDMDKIIYKLSRYYKENLYNINVEIFNFIDKFNGIGIKLEKKDFNFSKYVSEYMNTFFDEIENLKSKNIKETFEKIYWKCPDLIMHIELNLRNIYKKNEKKINKYLKKERENLLKDINMNLNQLDIKYKNLNIEYETKINNDKKRIINSFLENKINVADYEENKIKDECLKIVNIDDLNITEEEYLNLNNFYNNLYEYKNFIKFRFIFDDIKNEYGKKTKNIEEYNSLKKELLQKEKELNKVYKKINKKFLFFKNKKVEENDIKYNQLAKELKEIYKKLDKVERYNKILNQIDDSTSIFDVLKYASNYYVYLCEMIINQNSEITMPEIDETINEFKSFLENHNNIIIKNIAIAEEKDIPLIISDKYKLLNFNISKEDIEGDNINNLIDSLEKIKQYYYIKKNNINLENIKFITEFSKIKK